MQPKFRPIPAWITLMAIICFSTSCAAVKTAAPAATHQSILPANLSISLDESSRVEALVPQNGGQIKVSLANGLAYTLEIPQGALLSDQEVSMVPIRDIGGLPLSGGLIGGVELEPEGTTLMSPATLTISVPDGYDLRHMVGFSYHGRGDGFYLSPANGDGNTITIQVMSFSGHGAAAGSDQEINDLANGSTGSAADDYIQQITKILNDAKARDGSINDSDKQKLAELMKDNYDRTVKPALQAAVSDDTRIDTAANIFLSWWRNAQLLGIEDELQSRITEGNDLMVKGFKNAFDKASQRCVSNQDVKEATNMIKRLRQLALLGAADPGYNSNEKFDEFQSCLRFKVNLDSIITSETGANFNIISHVAGEVVLKLDPDRAALMNIFRGTGKLSFKEYTTEFTGDSEMMNSICKSEQSSKDGSMEMLGKIAWSNLNSNEANTNILLAIKPSALEQSIPNIKCDSGAQWIQTNFALNLPLWSSGFSLIHADTRGNLEDLTNAYLFWNFDYVGGNVLGRLVQSQTKPAGQGQVTEDISIDVTAAPGAE